jgi:hypothetical protein
MYVANLTTELVPVTVTHTATGQTTEVFIQPHGRARINSAYEIPANYRKGFINKLVFTDAPVDTPVPDEE